MTNPQSTCARLALPLLLRLRHRLRLEQHARSSARPSRSARTIYRGGLTIPTTLDPQGPEASPRSRSSKKVPIGNDEPHRRRGRASSEPGTGKVLALAQNTRSTPTTRRASGKTDTVNWTVDKKYGGTGGFQFGSTAKMFAIVRRPRDAACPSTARSRRSSPTTKQSADLQPERDARAAAAPGARGRSATTSRSAASRSTSTRPPHARSTPPSRRSSLKLGTDKVRKTMSKMGLHQGTGKRDRVLPGGRHPRRRRRHAADAGRLLRDPRGRGQVLPAQSDPVDHHGRQEADQAADRQRASRSSSTDVANGATELLKGVIEERHRQRRQARRRPSGGRQDRHHRQPRRVLVRRLHPPARHGRLGRHALQPEAHEEHPRSAASYYPSVFGGTIAAPIWKELMDRASESSTSPSATSTSRAARSSTATSSACPA